MKKALFLLPAAALLLSFYKPDEEYPFSKWDAATIEKANTAKDAVGYSEDEKKVVFYTNLVRLNPELFAKTYCQKYIDSTKTKATSFVNSMLNDLKTRYKPMGVYTIKQDLTDEAVDHAKDMGKSGKTGHFTADGKSYEFRMTKFKGVYTGTAETCDYGSNNPLTIVIHQLIDEGQANIEHRKTLLNKDLKYTGVSIQAHKKEKWNCVMEFAK